jgi:hypothetical protein
MNTYKYLQEKSEKPFNYIRSYIYKNYIKTVIENENTLEKNRIMFIANRFKSDFKNPMTFECNGLIVEYNKNKNKYKFLVIPIQLFNSQKLVKSEIQKHYNLREYNLYKVYDGTIINLYYYNNEWKISTNKAYDANNLIFISNKTYMDVLLEILTYYPQFSFENLDTNKCYTICMKYHQYHPFIENLYHQNNNKLIYLQSVNTTEFNSSQKLIISETDDIGLPISLQYNPDNFQSLNAIYSSLNSEITRYKKEKTMSSYEPIYGIILRSKNFSNTNEYSNIFIESNLMSKIRNLIYNHTFTKKLNFYNVLDKFNNMMIDKHFYNMLNLISLKIYLTKKDLNIFILLFPDFKPAVRMYEYMFKYMTKYMVKNYLIFDSNINNIDKILKNNLTLETNILPSEISINFNQLNKLMVILYIDIKNKKLNLNVAEQHDIVHDYLTNIAYLDYYYSYFYENE